MYKCMEAVHALWLPSVDSGYRGEIHAIISNVSGRTHTIQKGARVGQLIIMPVVIADFVSGLGEERGAGGFGSTGGGDKGKPQKVQKMDVKRRHAVFVRCRFCSQNCFKMS